MFGALWPTQLDLCDLLSTTTEFTKSAPNVIRLLEAKTECPPKVPIYPHSAPKPKFGQPLVIFSEIYTAVMAVSRNTAPSALQMHSLQWPKTQV